MATPRSTARKLTSEAEYRLVEESFPPSIENLNEKTIHNRMERARRLRDKYRRQAEGRRREIRGKTAQRRKAPARSNQLSVAKQRLFEETLARFEKRVSRGKQGKANVRSTSQVDLARNALAQKRAAGSRNRKPPSRTSGAGMKSKPASGPKGYFPAQGAKKGELSAAVKRGQARRDSRG